MARYDTYRDVDRYAHPVDRREEVFLRHPRLRRRECAGPQSRSRTWRNGSVRRAFLSRRSTLEA